MTDQRDRARVARYDLVDVTRCGEGWREMQRDDDYGEWVTYEDYASALADAERRVWERAAKVVQELTGKDSGNWNRAIVYAVAAIRKAQAGTAREAP